MKSPNQHHSIGKHWMLEIYGCNSEKLKTIDFVQKTLHESAQIAGATIVNENFHQFSPFGVSGVIVIEESHFTIHTWPEHHYAAVDIFTCGTSIDVQKAIDFLKQHFDAIKIEVKYWDRGELLKAKELSKNIMSNKF